MPTSSTDDNGVPDAGDLTEKAVDLARSWVVRSSDAGTRDDKRTAARLEGVVSDPDAVRFVMGFVDRVVRPDVNAVAAGQLQSLVRSEPLPGFLSPIDRLLLRAGARLGPVLPQIVMPLARRRMRAIVGHLVAPAETSELQAHLERQREVGYALNVNLLGEAVLGEREAERRFEELCRLLEQPAVDYVSVKISAVASQLNHFANADSLRRVTAKLEALFEHAAGIEPPTFVNLDMEEYHDLELTLDAFIAVLDRPDFQSIDAGIVLQAYLPDAFGALQRLVQWANDRNDRGGGVVKVRLVKGANLAMERVDAAIRGWEQAPYATKVETDANYKRCIDWLLRPERMRGVRLGLASHNLFDVAWTRLLSVERNVADKVQFEMLQGMAPAQATVVSADVADSRVLMYTPAVRNENFDVAISYLFRRLEENAADDNFMKHLFRLASDPAAFDAQAAIFRDAMKLRLDLADEPRRQQDRTAAPKSAYAIGEPFRNEPDTDPVLVSNHTWIDQVCAAAPRPLATAMTTTIADLDHMIEQAESGALEQQMMPLRDRQELLHRIGDELAARRGDFITTMMWEANKTFAEADTEVSEAIDFARYYGDRATDLDRHQDVAFRPLGWVAVIPPWNFPVAIPTGGVLSSLAAGNSAVLKPAPETPRCAELIAEACWAAGASKTAVQFVRTPDDHVGRYLVESADGVILTGAETTANLFRSWKPDLRLFAETSGKNALIITPNADIDLAVSDLVRSAFSHGGQKCSAASMAIVIGDTYESERFRRQLADAVQSLNVGPAKAIETDLPPLIAEPNERLARALTQLDGSEQWLVRPEQREGTPNLWSPGVRLGVEPGSWFQQTECFGPVLGLARAESLDEAIEIQNSSQFGLTGGIHTLDQGEVSFWLERVEVGNAYVNRPITGAIVQRQPFGGWKRSSVGPGAKAGGPNYVAGLGTWVSVTGQAEGFEVDEPEDDYRQAWGSHFSVEHDPTDLFCEANIFRYRPLKKVILRAEATADERELRLVRRAAAIAGVTLIESSHTSEEQGDLAARLATIGAARIRLVGGDPGSALLTAAAEANVHIASEPVTSVGRIELLHYVREQAVTETLHRFGNLTVQRSRTPASTGQR